MLLYVCSSFSGHCMFTVSAFLALDWHTGFDPGAFKTTRKQDLSARVCLLVTWMLNMKSARPLTAGSVTFAGKVCVCRLQGDKMEKRGLEKTSLSPFPFCFSSLCAPLSVWPSLLCFPILQYYFVNLKPLCLLTVCHSCACWNSFPLLYSPSFWHPISYFAVESF